MGGSFGYADSFGGRIAGDKRLLCELTIMDGKVVYDWNGRSGIDYADLGDDYGIREGEFRILPPA
jgi:dihydroorotase